MKRQQLVRLLGATLLAVSAFSMSAFAAIRITNVSISCGPDDDASMNDGEIVAPKFTSNSDQYEVVSYNATSDSGSYKTPRTYELILNARSGYYFPDEDQINVSASGVTQIVRKDTENEYSLTLRVKAYPYYKWEAPTVKTKAEDLKNFDTKSITWDRNGAPKVEYILEWTDQNGEDRSRTGASTSTSLSISSYNKKYTGNNSDKEDSRVTGFAIRATGNAGDNNRTAPSEWTKLGSVDPDNYDFPTYESWSEAVSSNVGGTVNSGATNNGGGGTIANGGWVQSGPDWYYRQNNGSYATGWLWDGTNWYLLDHTGRMQAGWYYDGVNWFYLNTAHDGTYGRMLTGWITVDGLQYYMNPVSDGTRGAMYVGWRMVDGRNRYFNEAHDGTFGRLIQ